MQIFLGENKMITKEKLQNHIAHLKEKHKEVDKLLIEADAHWEDNERINGLKKQKLHIKDEIVRLEKLLDDM
jgi:uncharacterized protein YdcH (DUF465 family)